MKHLSAFLVILLSAWTSAQAYKKESKDIVVNGQTRNMVVFTPDVMSDDMPLMIVTHGMNQSPEYQYENDNFINLIDTARFVVTYLRSDGATWDIGGTKDRDFVRQTIPFMEQNYGIDTNRVYWSGFSMGSMLMYHSMASMQDVIAAFAPTSGIQFSEQPWNSIQKPVNLIHCHAYADDVFGYEQYGIRAYVMNFATFNQYQKYTKTSGYSPVGPTWWSGDKEVWSEGTNGSVVELFSFTNGGHWPRGENAHEIWNFCKQFTLGPVAPRMVSATPENGSFDLPLTGQEFTVELSREVKVGTVRAMLSSGATSVPLSLVVPTTGGQPDSVVSLLRLALPEATVLPAGEYVLTLTGLATADGATGKDVRLNYTFGETEVDLDLVPATYLSTADWAAAASTIGEGIPLGWKRVNSNTDGTNDTKESGAANTGGARLKYFSSGGDFDAGFYFSAREYATCALTYGLYPEYRLHLQPGHYTLTVRAAYWNAGAESAGTTFTAAVTSVDGALTPLTTTTLPAAGQLSENTAQAVSGSALHSLPFTVDSEADYVLQFTTASGWNGLVIGGISISTGQSEVAETKAQLLRALRDAAQLLAAAEGPLYQGVDRMRTSVSDAIAAYTGFQSTSPAAWKEAAAAVVSACQSLLTRRNLVDAYAAVYQQALDLLAAYADDANISAAAAYARLRNTCNLYGPDSYSLSTNSNLSTAADRIQTGIDRFLQAATGIEGVQAADAGASAAPRAIYRLDGTRARLPLAPGFYVVDGRKVFVPSSADASR